MPGFQLREIAFTGPGKVTAQLRLRLGLNVITGPSDTGKTFVTQCIDYALGARNAPKEVPESQGYESILLRLWVADSGQEITLRRSARSGNVELIDQEHPIQTLLPTHYPGRQDSVSHLLLELTGITGKRILTNRQGVTRDLSFRDVARMVLVGEEAIISRTSPIYSGQSVSRTAEAAAFRLLLTGTDDSSVVASEDPRLVRVRQDGKAEVLGLLVSRAEEQLRDLQAPGDRNELAQQLVAAETALESLSDEVAAERESIAELETLRRDALERVRQIESSVDVLKELQHRFGLLKDQYTSDLRRLESIAEAGLRLAQMPQERCPVCGALAEHHEYDHRVANSGPEDVATASEVEAEKIRNLMADLEDTVVQNGAELSRALAEANTNRFAWQQATEDLRRRVDARLTGLLDRLGAAAAQRELYGRAVDLDDRLSELKQLLAEAQLTNVETPAVSQTVVIGPNETEDFSREIEGLLKEWHLPNLDRVTFSDRDQDVVISGRARASHGKGIRAITHAAFNLALLRYCKKRSLPHPGFVVIDSPLIVYEQPDPGENDFPFEVRDAFYQSLASEFQQDQVLVLENEKAAPSTALNGSVNLIKFTGTSQGRRGFFP